MDASRDRRSQEVARGRPAGRGRALRGSNMTAEVHATTETMGVLHADVTIAGQSLRVSYDTERDNLGVWHPLAPDRWETLVLVHGTALVLGEDGEVTGAAELGAQERATIEAALQEML